jgi:hypothetical protein
MPFESTSTLKIAYEGGGPSDGLPAILLHGWPDDVRTYDRVVPGLHAAGFRTIAPYLRGFGDTSFLSKETMRSGEIVAIAQDAIDLADALNLGKFALATTGVHVLPTPWRLPFLSTSRGLWLCRLAGNRASCQLRVSSKPGPVLVAANAGAAPPVGQPDPL